jgi:hypothetical protein
MDDLTGRRPNCPQITMEAVLLAIETGATCPHKLARVFGVHILHPLLHNCCMALTKLKVIQGSGTHHVEPGGFTCSVVEIVELARRDLP